ncbi:ABC transporter substrate-binding protein [Methylocella sp. CPCC 101449]|jgi:branched-chain amino acid transport system substrate-binding protein|uniref:ABC transporter substrate-binding protein n=1 Tax=Methylocella sp. CPCC 101449 TaxID=2987531 RepID=UPI00288E8D22|nr:ABC transporter substrate-binding protein [Methylocella sp. CPCC 101449]MDT2020020.1 ABC transporter substrate-binding protein [Methylocella sp. CPCC 101449]HEV2575040.1 ABC transporter substrate-binding protein [Beijerinckiaceae bacterium]
MRAFKLLLSLSTALALTTAASAEIRVGFVTSLSGAGSSIGIPYGRGAAAAYEYRSEVGGEKIRLIQLDDGSDPSSATRNTRKLVEEEKVDILIGTATAPSTIAMAAVAGELKTPMIAVSPINLTATGEQWAIAVPQPATLLVKVVADRMVRDGVKNVGFIGFSDAWGDLVYTGAKAAEQAGLIKVLTNERYARADTSVTGQILKVMAARPDGVLNGGSGTQGALPLLSLAERGYKGKNYGTVALINPDFVRVGGKAAEGIQVSAGPVIVAEQLPDNHFSKKISLAFREAYQKANNMPTTDVFSAYAFDGWLIFLGAAERALKVAKPGTPEFRTALKDEIFKTKELAGTHAVYNFKPGETYGVDDRALVIVKLENGAWKYAP